MTSVSFDFSWKDVAIINKSIERFTANAIRLGAQQVRTVDQSFTDTIEQYMLSRLTDQIPNGVIVKEI